VDDRVDYGMLKYAINVFKSQHPGSMLVNNPWGDSNMKGLEKAASALKINLAGREII
jgi:branched-chain amino acid transport system substrate-binding protein